MLQPTIIGFLYKKIKYFYTPFSKHDTAKITKPANKSQNEYGASAAIANLPRIRNIFAKKNKSYLLILAQKTNCIIFAV